MCVKSQKNEGNMEFNNIRYCKKIAKIDNINTMEMQKLQI